MAIEEIFDLITGLTSANAKHNQAMLRVEMAKMIARIQELEEMVKLLQHENENPLVFKKGLYYSADDTDNAYPYCSACYESSKKRIHLIRQVCPVCKADHSTPSGPVVMARHHTSPVLDGY